MWVIVGLTALFSLTVELLPVTSGYLQKHRQVIEQWAESVLSQPIHIESVDITRKGITPVIRFKNVEVMNDADNHVLTKVAKLEIGINIVKSLIKLQVEPSTIYVSGAHLIFYKSPNGDINLIEPGAKITDLVLHKEKNVSLDDVLEWFFTQKEISFNDLYIDLHISKKSSVTAAITNFIFRPGREIKQAELVAKNLGIKQKMPANLNFSLQLPDGALRFTSSGENKKLVDWLNQAFVNERSISGSVSLYGLLGDKFFKDQKQQFLLALHLRDANLNYYPKWPEIEKLNANLLFDGSSLSITADSGLIGGVPFYSTIVEIANFKKPILKISSKFNTDMDKILRFINMSPLKSSVGRSLENITLFGPSKLDLRLYIPLQGNDDVKVAGKLTLKNNSLSASNWNIKLKNLNGDIFFNERTLETSNLSGFLFDQKTNFNISTKYQQKERFTEINFAGAIDSKSLFKAMANHITESFSEDLQGVIAYKALLEIPANSDNSSNVLHLSSDLQGIIIDLPPPLSKAANEKIPTELVYKFRDNISQQLTLTYGNDLSFRVFFDTQKSPITSLGSSVTINVNEFNWPDWYNYFLEYKNESNLEIQDLTSHFTTYIGQITLNVGELKMMGQTLRFAKINIQSIPELKNLVVQITNSAVKGNLEIFYNQIRTLIKGRFSKLYLKSDDQNLSSLDPKNIPMLSINCNDFRYDDKNFGRVTLKTSPALQGTNIDNISIQSPFFLLTAAGQWLLENNKQRTNLHGKLNVPNLGNLFKAWSLGKNVENGKGNIDFNLAWDSPPFSLDPNIVSGTLQLTFRSGRIVNLGQSAEAGLGIGRFLSLLSLQSLPRRLVLDFSDLVTKGFSFDSLHGNLRIQNGNISTEDTHLEGVVAHVFARGRIGLKAKDYDLRLLITPHVTSSLPVVATIFGGPILGAATWVVDKLLSHEVKKVTATTYLITGSWLEPNIVKMASVKK
jgi:uncharacterized protein (TIGR02099 family)